LGVTIQLKEMSCLGNCPFDSDFNLSWGKKVITINLERWEDLDAGLVSTLIHEAAQALAKRSSSRIPNWPLFGWEYAVASQCGVVRTWLRGYSDYYVDTVAIRGYLGRLTSKKQRSVLQERLEAAEAGGLVIDGQPVVLR